MEKNKRILDLKNITLFICIVQLSFVYSQTTKVYKYNEETPKYEVQKTEKGQDVYEYNEYGLKNISPSIKVEDDKVYKVNEYGLKELFPEYELEDE